MVTDSISKVTHEVVYRIAEVEDTISSLDGFGYFVYYPEPDVIWAPPSKAIYNADCHYQSRDQALMRYASKDTIPKLEQLFKRIKAGEKKAEGEFLSNISQRSYRMSLSTVKTDANGNPLAVVGHVSLLDLNDLQNKTAQAEMNYLRVASEIVAGISTLFYAIYYIWVRQGTYICYQEHLNNIEEHLGKSGNCVDAWHKYIEYCVVPEDRERMHKFTDFKTLTSRLTHVPSISCTFKRVDAGWARAMFVVVRRDDNGHPENLLYVVTDVNSEVEAKQKYKEAKRNSLHDGLTLIKNRLAFEEEAEKGGFLAPGSALVLIDIDRFKDINDVFGHVFGDKVLVRVAKELTIVFGEENVFRFGGDEFVVFLPTFKTREWELFCNLVHEIHVRLNQHSESGSSVTLSYGVALADTSLVQTLKLADLALYETKHRSRSGCAYYNRSNGKIECWTDNIHGADMFRLMQQQDIASWSLAITPKGKRILIGDSMMNEKLGLPVNNTPEQIWDFVRSRLCGKSVFAMEHFIIDMKLGRLAEVTLQWEHPFKGKISIRWGGMLDKSVRQGHESSIFKGYVYLLDGVHIISGYDDTSGIRAALGEQYFCNYYICLPEQSFLTYKEQEDMKISSAATGISDLMHHFVKDLVAPESQADMTKFLAQDTLEERLSKSDYIDQEFLCTNDALGWCQARFIVVERNTEGKILSYCLVAESVAESHARRIQEQQEHLRRTLVLEKMVAMLSKGTLLAMGFREPDGRLIFRESRIGYSLGELSREEFIAREASFIDERDREKFMSHMGMSNQLNEIKTQGYFSYSTMMRREDKVCRIVNYHVCRISEDSDRLMFLIEDITRPSSQDPVSGVLNREGFMLNSDEIIGRVKAGEDLCLVDFNICNFRGINTVYGYESGDRVLRGAAEHLKQSAVEPILICRNKDDRFFCVVKTPKTTPEILNQCRNFQIRLCDGMHDIEFFCGVSHIDADVPSLAVCADHAMAAVQRVKAENIRSGICVFNDEMEKRYRDRVYVLENLDAAINEHQFVVMYQPIYDSYTKQPVSAEALVRWHNPAQGMVSPGVFVPALEQSGLMYRVDHYVQQQVLEFLLKRLRSGKRVVPIAVNVSRADLFNEEFIRKTQELLQTPGFVPSLLRFEVTESCFAELPQAGVKFLDELRKLGCRILIDDFGIGVSALRTVAEDDYDILKIDKSFIDCIGVSSKVETIIASIIGLGHSLGLGVTAEGVEQESQYEYLRDIGCNYIQGYFFSKPVSEDAFATILDNIDDGKVTTGPIILEANAQAKIA